MKVWHAFGSAHSAHLTIVGEFQNEKDASFAEQIVEDFVNASYEERYPNVEAFGKAWESRLDSVRYLGPSQADFDMGIDAPCSIVRTATTVEVSNIRYPNIGGIIKLMLLKDSTSIQVTGRTGP